MKNLILKINALFASLSYRTGIAALAVCVLFYAISFAQMFLPVSTAAKVTLWVIFFGLAKTAQYSALLILGKAGVESLRGMFSKRRIKRPTKL